VKECNVRADMSLARRNAQICSCT